MPSEPSRTTATYGEWLLRCERPGTPGEMCEVAQVVSDQGRQVGELAIGRPNASDGLRATVVVPPSVAFSGPARLSGSEGDAAVPTLDLAWQRCLPGGCFADARIADDAIAGLGRATRAVRITFQDAAGHDAVLLFSPRGLPQAVAALARREGR